MPTAAIPAPATAGASAPPSADTTTRPSRRTLLRINLALFGIGVATFALLFSTQALLPDLAAAFAVGPSRASWTVSAATVALAAAVLPLSLVSERFGRRRVMTASAAAAVALALLIPLAPSLTALIALRALQGAALAGIPASAVAYLSEELDRKAMVGAVGLFIAGNSVGGMSGRIVTGWVAEGHGWRAGLAAVALLALTGVLAYGLLLPRARNFTPVRLRPRAALRTITGHLGNPLLVRLFTVGMLLMAAFSSVYTAIGFRLTAEPFGLSAGLVGSVFVIYLVGTGSSALTGPTVDRLGRRGALYAGIGATATGLLLTLSGDLTTVLAGLVLITAGFFLGHAVASSAVGRTVTEGRAQASALYQVMYYLGASAGGTLGALTYDRAAWAGTVTFALTALAATAAITLYATARARATRRALAAAA